MDLTQCEKLLYAEAAEGVELIGYVPNDDFDYEAYLNDRSNYGFYDFNSFFDGQIIHYGYADSGGWHIQP